MMSTLPLWWFALPVLLLPVWWHRQKRQRLKAEPLATARFLPSAAPEQLRVWQWRDRILLLARCLLLVTLIAWLAALFFPWRGDTVLLDPSADQAWAEQQIAARKMSAAQRIALPDDAFGWLRQHERDWRPDARLLIVAASGKVAMPARLPQFAHNIELQVQPPAASPERTASSSAADTPRAASPERTAGSSAADTPRASSSERAASSSAVDTPRAASPERAAGQVAAPRAHHVALAAPAPRLAAWRALFAAFDVAGAGADRYILSDAPDASTELIIWDMPATPPAAWRAPLWWLAVNAGTPPAPDLANAPTLTINGIALKYADTPRGRIWSSPVWPAKDADAARALYEAWQALTHPAPVYPAPSQAFAAAPRAAPPLTDPDRANWLAYALLALFTLERILTHARRT